VRNYGTHTEKFDPFRLAFQLEVIGTDRDRSATYSTQLNVYLPIEQTEDTEVIHQMHGRLPERPKPIYAGHPWL